MTVSMSSRKGTLRMTQGASVSSVPIRIGSAEFLAPEIRISPCSGWPPSIVNRSNENSFLGFDDPGQARQILNQLAALPEGTFAQKIQHSRSLVCADFQQQKAVRL